MNDDFSIDLISDLNLTDSDMFDWDGKSTSLFCVVAGNVSNDLLVLENTLEHLSNSYRGVFFIDGSLEHTRLEDYGNRIEQIREICQRLNNVVYLHNHLVILNNVAFIGCNGWYGNRKDITSIEDLEYLEEYRSDDLGYLSLSIKRVQHMSEVKKVVIITNSIPGEYFAFNSPNVDLPEKFNLSLSLLFDNNSKIKKWLFGTSDITVDVNINDRQYVNNPVTSGLLYFPKKIDI
jgi:hypothetical protein